MTDKSKDEEHLENAHYKKSSQNLDKLIKKRQPTSIKYKKTTHEDLLYLDVVKGRVGTDTAKELKTLGFQARNIYKASNLILDAIKSKDYKIVLGFTSNAVSSGLRDLIALYCKHNLVDYIVTTAGGIEQDVLKEKFTFRIKAEEESDQSLREAGINRTENLYVPNDAYVYLQKLTKKLLQHELEGPKEIPAVLTVSQLIDKFSSFVSEEDSYLYWCSKNKIPVISTGIEDGAIGDFLGINNYNAKKNKSTRKIIINSADSLTQYLEFIFNDYKKILVIILGGGAPKHFIMNGCIAAGGADTAIYLNDDNYHTGSNAGAPLTEAVSWGKLKAGPNNGVKVQGDFILTFYLLSKIIFEKLNIKSD